MLRRGLMLALLVALVPAVPASAGSNAHDNGSGDGAAWTDDSGVGARASFANKATVTPTRASGRSSCTYGPVESSVASMADRLATTAIAPLKSSDTGSWTRKTCLDAVGNSISSLLWVPARRPSDPRVLARQALTYEALPVPGVRLNPAPDQGQIVNFQTWLWLDPATWAPVRASASAGPVTVTVTGVPERVVWDMGNGDHVTCAGPGTSYDASRPAAEQRSNCTYTYRRSSAGQPADAFTLTATAQWHVTWSGDGASGDLGIVSRSFSLPVRVGEVQALNTSFPEGDPQ